MDYSKAQMVSVDDWLVTLPLVFVTVTKRMKVPVTLDLYKNVFHFADEVFVLGYWLAFVGFRNY